MLRPIRYHGGKGVSKSIYVRKHTRAYPAYPRKQRKRRVRRQKGGFLPLAAIAGSVLAPFAGKVIDKVLGKVF